MPWIIGGAAALGAGASLLGASKQADATDRASRISEAQYNQTRQDLEPWRQAGTTSLSELMYRMGLSPNRTGASAPSRDQFMTAPSPAGSFEKFGAGGMPFGSTLDTQGNVVLPGGQSTAPGFDQSGFDAATAKFNAGNQNASQDPNFGSLTKSFGLNEFQQSPAYQFNLQEGEKAINKGASARGNYYAPQTLQDIGKYSQGVASNEFQNAYGNYNTNMNNIWNRLYGLSGAGQSAANQTGAYGASTANQVGQNMIGGANAQAAGLIGGANAIAGGVGNYYNNQLMQQVLSQRPTYGWQPTNGNYSGMM